MYQLPTERKLYKFKDCIYLKHDQIPEMAKMKKFGGKFGKYEPLEVDHISVPSMDTPLRVGVEPTFLGGSKKKRKRKRRKTSSITTEKNSETDLRKAVVGVAPVPNVYLIPPDLNNISDRIRGKFSLFDYYLIELGFNVMVGREFDIPELLFKVTLDCDKDKTDVFAYDIAPTDESKYTRLLQGKVRINLGITTLLKFFPSPIDKIIPNLLDIDLNPWEFEWGIEEYLIDACGRNNYNVHWKIYETKTVQGFNPTMIIQARKNVSEILANVSCIYKLRAKWGIISEIKSQDKKIEIWPI